MAESSLNPDAPEFIPNPPLAPLPRPPPPPGPRPPPPPGPRLRPPLRPMYMLLPVHEFLPVMLPTHQFLPVILSTHPYPPALQPHPYPIVDSPPQEKVRRRRHRMNTIATRVRGMEIRIILDVTTVMIKNIPFHYNRGSMMEFLDYFCLQENIKARDSNRENIHVFAYDYLYLPLHFKKNRIRGYALVNFTDERTLWKFFLAFSDGATAFPNSARSVKLSTAYIQGEKDLRRRYQYARFKQEAIGFNPPRDGSHIIAS
ncbi:protein terminal ear1 homolog [Solanum pennellii]|uniref:Protein terminal ear1 homolog n=1 Tax=Solanum pennellii TaxID=28526 RepID=A0ABM1V2C0_SOLPN|nr:protein terminal ear1 homolog [Solanum pennellii]